MRERFDQWHRKRCLRSTADWQDWREYEAAGAMPGNHAGGLIGRARRQFLRCYVRQWWYGLPGDDYAALAEWLTVAGHPTKVTDLKNAARAENHAPSREPAPCPREFFELLADRYPYLNPRATLSPNETPKCVLFGQPFHTLGSEVYPRNLSIFRGFEILRLGPQHLDRNGQKISVSFRGMSTHTGSYPPLWYTDPWQTGGLLEMIHHLATCDFLPRHYQKDHTQEADALERMIKAAECMSALVVHEVPTSTGGITSGSHWRPGIGAGRARSRRRKAASRSLEPMQDWHFGPLKPHQLAAIQQQVGKEVHMMAAELQAGLNGPARPPRGAAPRGSAGRASGDRGDAHGDPEEDAGGGVSGPLAAEGRAPSEHRQHTFNHNAKAW